MEWDFPFVVIRVQGPQEVKEVFRAHDLKKAKYWLTYIAQAGDVLCNTPAHPKHPKDSAEPKYWCHKEGSGKLLTDEGRWRETTVSRFGEFALPHSPASDYVEP